ncbi:CPBP family intramembrane metalloprotease [Phormidium sp. CLA17]|uniref:CPBP family intramembrane glutamic endopeptidase n=1 Tax=Leptolyngbya sp. Cla-17 TaxID=2803751 RepID=UPI00149130A9|nr:type II CAAX endopeptidase family protein [Leptolyngbya sp. Cla-17]MBM0741398.1 CPBP family intramembrane metalloprotease [Leptolyngbya sp. Cla-17]
MTIKRVILVTLTVLAIFLMGQDLLSSWNQPQVQSRLELYQTNLLLRATELQESDPTMDTARKALLGAEPTKNALKQYQDVQQQVQQTLKQTQSLLATDSSNKAQLESLGQTERKLTRLLTELNLKLGILRSQQGEAALAQKEWDTVIQQAEADSGLEPLAATAVVLQGLWAESPQLLPNAEPQIQKNLDGWFRDRALTQLYTLQQRSSDLQALAITEQQAAEKALTSLAIVGGIPVLSCVIGTGLLIFAIGQWVLQRKQAILSIETLEPWITPWDGETIWQVLILGFFMVGQIALPILLAVLQQQTGLNPSSFGEQGRALFILFNYVLLAAGGLGVLYWSIQSYLPLPEDWFRINLKGNWFWWGLGGYFAALPLVIVVSLVNQKIWQGRGGSNPILPIALEGKNSFALAIFFVTAAIAAPIFEEILFRGFLLSSLTRYFPVWGAIILSSFLFAVAHLSLSEVLPLMTLGMVLGFVYSRSRNLLSSMLLHSLWNSGTLLSLFVLGSGQG